VRQAKIANLKNNLSRYLDHVRRGGSVIVLDRDRPVDRLGRLERQGLIRRGGGGRSVGARKPVRLPGGVLRGLLEERERGW